MKPEKDIIIGDYTYVVTIHRDNELYFYLDKTKSKHFFQDGFDPFSFGEYYVNNDMKGVVKCPNPFKLKDEIVDFVTKVMKAHRLPYLTYHWNDDKKRSLYIKMAEVLCKMLGSYEFFVDDNESSITIIRVNELHIS